MKVGGISITPPEEDILVLRLEPEPLVFRARPLADYDEFEKLCQAPKAPAVLTKKGVKQNTEDKNYQHELLQYNLKFIGFLVIRTLEPSEIEWDTVDPYNSNTWLNYEKDFANAGLTRAEVNTVTNFATNANMLNEAKLEKARELFLLGQQGDPSLISSPSSEPSSTPSGEPAPASA